MLKVLIAFFFLMSSQFALALSSEVEKTYPAPWLHDFNFEITKSLTQAKVKQCGIIKYRPSVENEGEFLVACSSDDANWKAYMVWPRTGQVLGPYSLD